MKETIAKAKRLLRQIDDGNTVVDFTSQSGAKEFARALVALADAPVPKDSWMIMVMDHAVTGGLLAFDSEAIIDAINAELKRRNAT